MGVDVGVADMTGVKKRPRMGDVEYLAYYRDRHDAFELALQGTWLPLLSRRTLTGISF